FQVVGEAAGASDAADEHDVLAAQPEFGQKVADGVQDDVVAAAGAPADFLVTGEVLALLRLFPRRQSGHTCVLRQLRSDSEFSARQIAHQVGHTPAPTLAADNLATIVLSCSSSSSRPARAARMRRPISSAKNDTPLTLVTECTSTRYLARNNIAS